MKTPHQSTDKTSHSVKLQKLARRHAKQIITKLTMRPHLTDVDGFYDMCNDEVQMIDIVEKYLSKLLKNEAK